MYKDDYQLIYSDLKAAVEQLKSRNDKITDVILGQIPEFYYDGTWSFSFNVNNSAKEISSLNSELIDSNNLEVNYRSSFIEMRGNLDINPLHIVENLKI